MSILPLTILLLDNLNSKTNPGSSVQKLEPVLEIYTDGSCWNKGKNKSYNLSCSVAVFVLDNKIIEKLVTIRNHTTSNVAEIDAIILALEVAWDLMYLNVKIYTDSEYAIKRLTRDMDSEVNFSSKLKYEGFHNAMEITFQHVKGHNGNKYNEIADNLCRTIRKKHQSIIKDLDYEG